MPAKLTPLRPGIPIQVAFDGLLHFETRDWTSASVIDPTPRGRVQQGATNLLQHLIENGFSPIIFSTRAAWGDGLSGISDFLRRYLFPDRLPISSYFREDVPYLGPNVYNPHGYRDLGHFLKSLAPQTPPRVQSEKGSRSQEAPDANPQPVPADETASDLGPSV